MDKQNMVFTYSGAHTVVSSWRKGILIPATTWINIEDITLSEISQSRKEKHGMIPLIRGD